MSFCKNRPFFVAVLVLGLLAVTFHLIGFVAPGWVVLTFSNHEVGAEKAGAMMMMGMIDGRMPNEDFKKKETWGKEDEKTRDLGNELPERPEGSEHPSPRPEHISNQVDPSSYPNEEMERRKMEREEMERRKMQKEGEMESGNDMEGKENNMKGDPKIDNEVVEVKQWARQTMENNVVNKMEIQYGLLFSKFCIVGGIHKEATKPSKDKDENCVRKCKTISPKTAMLLSNTFEVVHGNGMMKKYPSTKDIGYANLNEHRVELAVALALLVIGVLAGSFAFWKREGPKVAAIVCILSLLVGVVLISIPTMRFACYNHQKIHSNDGVEVHCPLSVIATGISTIFLLIAIVVAAFGLFSKTRKSKADSFYRFTNDSEKKFDMQKKGPDFSSDRLPEKVGYYDNAGVKPVEIILAPEKITVA